MIEGLHFDIKFDELKEHLESRDTYHRGRARWYSERIKDLKEGGVESDSQVSGGDPLQNLQRNATKHENRADLFCFMADHLVEDETYRLEESDLKYLEFIRYSY